MDNKNKNNASASTVDQAINDKFKNLTTQDFENGEVHKWMYDYLKKNDSTGAMASIMIDKVSKLVKEKFGAADFKKFYTAYSKKRTKDDAAAEWAIRAQKTTKTNFSNLPEGQAQLICNGYVCNDNGVKKITPFGDQVVSYTPILPVSIVRNIETRNEKIDVLCKDDDGKWIVSRVPTEDLMISSSTHIGELIKHGIRASTTTAPRLTEYMEYMLSANKGGIPVIPSISHLGYYDDGRSFMPYSVGDGNVVCDAKGRAAAVVNAVRVEGSFEEWKKTIAPLRERSPELKIMLASALASPLISIVGTLPFVTHLQAKTGTGKTVALMISSSVFGDPDRENPNSKMIVPFSTSLNAMEILCAVHGSGIPFFIDEAQTKPANVSFEDIIYRLTQGAGRDRAAKNGGLQDSNLAWNLSIITTGEVPLTEDNSGGGAMARVISLSLPEGSYIVGAGEGAEVCRSIKENFGHAGKAFVEYILDHKEEVIATYNDFYKAITPTGNGAQSKAYDSTSLILTADKIASRVIWGETDDTNLIQIDDIMRHVKDTAETNQHELEKQWLACKVAEYEHLFLIREKGIKDEDTERFVPMHSNTQQYIGVITDESISIIATTLRSWFSKNYKNSGLTAFLNWCKAEGILIHNEGGLTRKVRIRAQSKGLTTCYSFKRGPLTDNLYDAEGEAFEK